MLNTITTSTRVGGTKTAVDTYTLGHQFVDPGDSYRAQLWLSSITRTGATGTGGPVSLPAVTFTGTQMANRVPAPQWTVNNYRRPTTTGSPTSATRPAPTPRSRTRPPRVHSRAASRSSGLEHHAVLSGVLVTGRLRTGQRLVQKYVVTLRQRVRRRHRRQGLRQRRTTRAAAGHQPTAIRTRRLAQRRQRTHGSGRPYLGPVAWLRQGDHPDGADTGPDHPRPRRPTCVDERRPARWRRIPRGPSTRRLARGSHPTTTRSPAPTSRPDTFTGASGSVDGKAISTPTVLATVATHTHPRAPPPARSPHCRHSGPR